MPKTVLADQNAWARILYAVNPDGRVPNAGPAATVAAFAEQQMAPSRAFEPVKLDPEDLLLHDEIDDLRHWADELSEQAEDVHGRGIINLAPQQKARLREMGVIDRLQRAAGREFDAEFEALLMYYRDQGSLPLHVDDQAEYRFNALLNVRRVRPEHGTTTGTLFWLKAGPCSIDLDPGEAVIFDAHFTPHGRLPLVSGDEVVLLSLGFRPV